MLFLSDFSSPANVSSDEQSVHIWPNSFRYIQALEATDGLSSEQRSLLMSCFSGITMTEISIPCYGCIVFPSDTLHSGAPNRTKEHRFRGFCMFQGNKELGFENIIAQPNYHEIHHVVAEDLKR